MMSVFGRDLSRKQVLRTGEQGHGDTRGAAGDGSERLWELGWKFYDADDYHSEENRIKMGKGVPLNDQDRIPWLCSLHDILLRYDVIPARHNPVN
ncbi:probable gluconokinase isoform X5 [Rattus norvegicus]|uniref:probable gluconokinase isoform X5 n=1 Tax=Rattus norvegicus TaxID=10116 RepID=UPI002FD7B95D